LRLGTILKQPWFGVDGMTGVDLAREIQALQPELVVFLVSGYADGLSPPRIAQCLNVRRGERSRCI
jgi:hypothetical protein